MKEIRLLTIIAGMMLIVPAKSFAQVRIGVTGGVDITEMRIKHDVFNADNRLGWFAGPTLEISIPQTNFGIDLSALYNQRSSKIDVYELEDPLSGNFVETKTLKTKQLVVPLHVNFALLKTSSLSLFVFAGPQMAFRIGDDTQSFTSLREDMGEWKINDSNFSVNVGGGFCIGKAKLTANYNVGVGKTGEITFRDATDAVKEGWNGSYDSWQIALSYYF